MPALRKRKGESESGRQVRSAMTEFNEGKLHSGSKTGPKVTNRKQAVAIGLSKARRAGAKVPKAKKKSGARKKSRMKK